MKRLALTTDGRMTWCTADDEHIGKGRCNHVAHQKIGESAEQFLERVEAEKKTALENQEPKPKKQVVIEQKPAEIYVDPNYDLGDKKYGSNPELDEKVDSQADSTRQNIATQGYGLDKLVNDEKWYVREIVAKQGYGLEKLVNDEESYVRSAVASQGYGLDKLVNDESYKVRIAVAEQGYGLDKLVNDEDNEVRAAVADQGYGLDKLVEDEDWRVRRAVSRRGYGLDKLVDDEDYHVRIAVAEQGYGLEKLINSTGEGSTYIKETCKAFMKQNGIKDIREYKTILVANGGDYSIFSRMRKNNST